jgi:hypothetical protein
MSLRIYTPGHGLFLDSLIMYGLASALSEGNLEYHVIGSAHAFELSVESASASDVANLIAYVMERCKESVVKLLADDLRLVQREVSNKMRAFLSEVATSDKVKRLLQTYFVPGHARDEGREARGKQHVWLPFYPHIGKYFAGEYRYKPKEYGVCPFCIALASLGFFKAALPIRYPPPGITSNVVILSFEGKVSGDVLNRMMSYVKSPEFVQEVLERRSLHRAARMLPLATFNLMLLTFFSAELLEALYEAAASWTALSTTFDVVKGGVVQVRGYEEMSIDQYLSSLVRLIEADEKRTRKANPLERLRILAERLLREGGEDPAALEALYRFLLSRTPSDLYTASRQVVKRLGEGFGKDFCEELACLIQ